MQIKKRGRQCLSVKRDKKTKAITIIFYSNKTDIHWISIEQEEKRENRIIDVRYVIELEREYIAREICGGELISLGCIDDEM